MFNHTKYAKWYKALIEKARNRSDKFIYGERHHIVPFCISRSNAKSNIVMLTGREHFIAHMLLIKSVEPRFKSQMIYAIRKMMCTGKGQNRVVSSRTFEQARRFFAEQKSLDMKAKWADPKKRKEHSDKLKKTLSTPESRQLKRDAALKSSTPEVIAKRAEGHRGLKHSEETKQKMRESYKRRMAAKLETALKN